MFHEQLSCVNYCCIFLCTFCCMFCTFLLNFTPLRSFVSTTSCHFQKSFFDQVFSILGTTADICFENFFLALFLLIAPIHDLYALCIQGLKVYTTSYPGFIYHRFHLLQSFSSFSPFHFLPLLGARLWPCLNAFRQAYVG